jgi:hypothetical protein
MTNEIASTGSTINSKNDVVANACTHVPISDIGIANMMLLPTTITTCCIVIKEAGVEVSIISSTDSNHSVIIESTKSLGFVLPDLDESSDELSP